MCEVLFLVAMGPEGERDNPRNVSRAIYLNIGMTLVGIQIYKVTWEVRGGFLGEEDNLNNRFKPIEGLRTDAIFSIDDDVVVPCSTLEFAFSVWQSAPDSMVGFVPRMHWVDTKVLDSLYCIP